MRTVCVCYAHAFFVKLVSLFFAFSITLFYVTFLYTTLVGRNCAHYAGKLLLKCSTVGTGFNGAETNNNYYCGISRILGILLMNSYCIQIFWISVHASYYLCPCITTCSIVIAGRSNSTAICSITGWGPYVRFNWYLLKTNKTDMKISRSQQM